MSVTVPQPTAHFGDIAQAIIKYMKDADVVKVCSAWFTCPLLLEQIGQKEAEVIIGSPSGLDPSSPEYRKNWVADLYEALEKNVYVYYGGREGHCHHKFMVLCRYNQESKLCPYAVITGSYNYTVAARCNIENVVYIPNESVAAQYLTEFNRVKAQCGRLSV